MKKTDTYCYSVCRGPESRCDVRWSGEGLDKHALSSSSLRVPPTWSGGEGVLVLFVDCCCRKLWYLTCLAQNKCFEHPSHKQCYSLFVSKPATVDSGPQAERLRGTIEDPGLSAHVR